MLKMKYFIQCAVRPHWKAKVLIVAPNRHTQRRSHNPAATERGKRTVLHPHIWPITVWLSDCQFKKTPPPPSPNCNIGRGFQTFFDHPTGCLSEAYWRLKLCGVRGAGWACWPNNFHAGDRGSTVNVCRLNKWITTFSWTLPSLLVG